MVIAGKRRAVAKSVYPEGISSQEEWEQHARRKVNEYRWRLDTIDKEDVALVEVSLNEYGHTSEQQEMIDEDLQQEADYERRSS